MGNIERWWLAADPRGRGLVAYHAEAVARNQAARANGAVIEVVPASQLEGAVEALRRIAAGHAHPAKLAGEALDALPPDDNVYDPPYVERGQ